MAKNAKLNLDQHQCRIPSVCVLKPTQWTTCVVNLPFPSGEPARGPCRLFGRNPSPGGQDGIRPPSESQVEVVVKLVSRPMLESKKHP